MVTIMIETIAGPDGDARGQISVRDNGCGFAVDAVNGAGTVQGRGLLNMKKRAALCDVTLSVTSAPLGTTVSLLLPPDFPEATQGG